MNDTIYFQSLILNKFKQNIIMRNILYKLRFLHEDIE